MTETKEDLKILLHKLGYSSDKEDISNLSEQIEEMFYTLLTTKDKEREEAVKHARKVTSIEALETLHNAFFTPKMHVAIEEDGSMFLVPIEPDTKAPQP